ncbi:MAG: hypothetical protein QGG14_02070 [Planctomycetota bacterium]|nr:hypothetical protein [Planctomycetota bacterium]
MRRLILCIWLVVPVAAWTYHEGPGQDKMALDDAAAALREAQQWVAAEDWATAIERFEDALKLLPKTHLKEARRIRLERDKAQMLSSKLPQAHADLLQLVDELATDPGSDKKVLDEARETLANAQYYLTWLMRLEGQPREKWEPQIEAARQSYRLLAEKAEKNGDKTAAKRSTEDLESAIRLARMDLKDLQGLPLPSQ